MIDRFHRQPLEKFRQHLAVPEPPNMAARLLHVAIGNFQFIQLFAKFLISLVEEIFCSDRNVSAMDKDTGKRQEITIQGSSNMSREEIDRAVREAQQYAAEDAKAKSDAQIKDRLESLLYRSEEARKHVDKEQKKQIDEAVKAVKRALKHKDTQEMTAAADTLEALIGTQNNTGNTV